MTAVRVFNHNVHTSLYWLALADAVLLFASVYAGAWLYCLPQAEGETFNALLPQLPLRAIIYAIVAVICLSAMGLYEQRMREGRSGILLRSVGGYAAAVVITTIVFLLLPESSRWSRILLYTVPLSLLASSISRALFVSIALREQFKSRVLVYGSGYAASTITSSMRRKTDRQKFTIVGFVRVDGEESRVTGERVISLREPLAEYAQKAGIDQIVVALDNQRDHRAGDELFQCRMQGTKVLNLVSFFEREAGKILVDFANPGWMSMNESLRAGRAGAFSKRFFDLLTCGVLLSVTWPAMLITALAIWVEDGFRAPVFFSQERIGLHGKAFRVLKFRSMSVDAESDGKARWATENDSRITRVGAFIRRTRIDELPQIFNVLAGDMAFIGPRPERPEFVRELVRKIPFYDSRHAVKPGITGWAQLCYPYGSSEEDARQKLQFDLYYVKNQNLLLDIMISLSTVEVVLFGKGAR